MERKNDVPVFDLVHFLLLISFPDFGSILQWNEGLTCGNIQTDIIDSLNKIPYEFIVNFGTAIKPNIDFN